MTPTGQALEPRTPGTEAGKAAEADWARLAESGDVGHWDDGTDIYDHIAAHISRIEAEAAAAALVGVAGGLDAAWKAAEAALPEGWEFAVRYRPVVYGESYTVEWSDGQPKPLGAVPVRFADTPTAALQALTALLVSE